MLCKARFFYQHTWTSFFFCPSLIPVRGRLQLNKFSSKVHIEFRDVHDVRFTYTTTLKKVITSSSVILICSYDYFIDKLLVLLELLLDVLKKKESIHVNITNKTFLLAAQTNYITLLFSYFSYFFVTSFSLSFFLKSFRSTINSTAIFIFISLTHRWEKDIFFFENMCKLYVYWHLVVLFCCFFLILKNSWWQFYTEQLKFTYQTKMNRKKAWNFILLSSNFQKLFVKIILKIIKSNYMYIISWILARLKKFYENFEEKHFSALSYGRMKINLEYLQFRIS